MICAVKIDFQRAMAAPPGAREVILVRHGACDPPAPDGLIDGRSDPSLNERGREEAAAAGERLARESVAAVFISHLRRTEETAAAILASPPAGAGGRRGHRRDLPRRVGGPRDPRPRRQRRAELARVFAEQRWDLVPGAEPIDEWAARVRRGLEAARRRRRRRQGRGRGHPLGGDRRVLPRRSPAASPSPSCSTPTAR